MRVVITSDHDHDDDDNDNLVDHEHNDNGDYLKLLTSSTLLLSDTLTLLPGSLSDRDFLEKYCKGIFFFN